jgi:DNA repair ATPase RecN
MTVEQLTTINRFVTGYAGNPVQIEAVRALLIEFQALERKHREQAVTIGLYQARNREMQALIESTTAELEALVARAEQAEARIRQLIADQDRGMGQGVIGG